MDAASRLVANAEDAATVISELEAISRRRVLTDAESLLLERAILHNEGKRLPRGLTRALARRGIKRDMRRFR